MSMTGGKIWAVALVFAAGGVAMGCGDDGSDKKSATCSVEAQTGCPDGQECQAVEGGEPACFCSVAHNTGCEEGLACEEIPGKNSACFAPVTVTGRVFDLATDDGVEGARVLARDANDVAVSGVAVTAEDGTYELRVPSPRTPEGDLLENRVTLRADAQGYLTFPRAPRVAVPFDIAGATGDPPTLASGATDIGLIALESTDGLGSVSGTVLADEPAGTLVVAGTGTGGTAATALAGTDGAYVVFNVPAGDVSVRGFKTGTQLRSETASVTAGQTTEGVDLHATGDATAIVSGKIDLVDPGGGNTTSVILAVDATFDANAARGEAPPGLRAAGVSGAWSIEGVPDGDYVVLAAFENDSLVRDPDQSIGGTDLVRISVSGSNVDLADGFKVTGALAVVGPDDEAVVSATPTLQWEDDSSEDHYEVRVVDAFGNELWNKNDVPAVMGNKSVSVTYGGPALESGGLYQFRATSIKRNGQPISTTEDLRGVFLVE